MSSGRNPRSSGSQRDSNPIDSQLDEQVFDFDLSLDDEVERDVSQVKRDVSQVKETQFAEMEIDTQATESYDRRELFASQQTAAQKRFAVPDDEDDLPPAFTFSKAQKKTLAIGIPRMAGPAREPAKESAVEKSAVGE